MTKERKPTTFENKVYQALMEIPCGRVTTYASLARRLGIRSAQAVGQALRRNPHAPQVPCHRVIRTDGTLGGYSGEVEGEQIQRKIRLLAEEGVMFDAEGKIRDTQQIWEYESQ